ncbi:MAG TPA: hypothetical protein PK965_09615, partial [Anaerohalosphaeraceae bacterium]|nr:hypothetical protein [Anaerohalosphaeraceae bacterium]
RASSARFQSLIHQGKNASPKSAAVCDSDFQLLTFQSLIHQGKNARHLDDWLPEHTELSSFNPLFIRGKMQDRPLQVLCFQGVARAKTVIPLLGVFFQSFFRGPAPPNSL